MLREEEMEEVCEKVGYSEEELAYMWEKLIGVDGEVRELNKTTEGDIRNLSTTVLVSVPDKYHEKGFSDENLMD